MNRILTIIFVFGTVSVFPNVIAPVSGVMVIFSHDYLITTMMVSGCLLVLDDVLSILLVLTHDRVVVLNEATVCFPNEEEEP